ncbi:hypothetical protein CQA38_05405 [Campylobacter sp. MIT 12-5580]|uniref:hypothetical protein n=1 Tax=Campylobacter sp. MIT 12-5580 TaxID=2040651 RepID=UPI0010FA2EE4|nr:hypothetical protein [Campylobacter sp. MIT 12-5580]TKX29003.1 hypothetical protein CQA38_05405 [Campylobacter sp. MIT 12-5580]
MKKSILISLVFLALGVSAIAANHNYQSERDFDDDYTIEERAITCATFKNCQTIKQPIYQEAFCKWMGWCR